MAVSEEQASATVAESYDGAALVENQTLRRDLKGRHMQMIAIGSFLSNTCDLPYQDVRKLETYFCRIGGAIGAGLFVGTGSALHSGGPGSLVRYDLFPGSSGN